MSNVDNLTFGEVDPTQSQNTGVLLTMIPTRDQI